MALVLWHGGIGGAEVLCAELARSLRDLGLEPEVVFITSAGPLSERLARDGIAFRTLGHRRGREILLHPRRYAAAVSAAGSDAALLPECGFIGAALRLGGYAGRIVAVEHGALLMQPRSRPRALLQHVARMAGAWADDVEIGVSDFMLARMRERPHARRLQRIYNGIDPERYRASADGHRPETPDAEVVIGFAGRLIHGKGTDDAISAIARIDPGKRVRLLIAGDGPERIRLTALADHLGVSDRVEFRGMLSDMRSFWGECDIATFPSHQFPESFGMALLEAMACAKAVVATASGATPELVADGQTGRLVAAGDVDGLAEAFLTYAERSDLRRAHGRAARAQVAESFHIVACARKYARCFGVVLDDERGG